MQAARSVSTSAGTGDYFRPRRLGHVNLVVSDVDRSMDFYLRIVGLEEAYRRPTVRAGFLSNNNTHHDIGMVESAGPLGMNRSPGLNHVAFELETEVDLVNGYHRAVAEGVRFVRTADHDIAHAVYGKDPDGNQYEIYADVVRDWRRVRSGIVTKPKPNWTPGSTPPCAERNYDPAPVFRRVESAVFHPLRATHACLVVENYEDAFDHYTGVVGLVPLMGGRDGAYAVLGGTLRERSLSLFRATRGRAPGLHHVGFQVTDDADLDASIAKARRQGCPPEIVVDHALRRVAMLRDPDGIRLQFFVERNQPETAWADCDPDMLLLLA